MNDYIFKKFEARNSLLAFQGVAASETFNDRIGERIMQRSGTFYRDGFAWWIGHPEDYERARAWVLAHLEKDPEWGNNFCDSVGTELGGFVAGYESARSAIDSWSGDETIESARALLELCGRVMSTPYFTDWVAYDAQRWIRTIAPEDVMSDQEFTEIVSGSAPSFSKQFEYAMARVRLGLDDTTAGDIVRAHRFARDNYQHAFVVDDQLVVREIAEMDESVAQDIVRYVEHDIRNQNLRREELLARPGLSSLASSTLRLLAQFVDLQDARKYAVFVTNALLLAAFKRVLDRRGFDAPDQEAIIQHAFPWWIVEKDPAGLLNDVSVAQTGALKVAYQQECIGASASEHFDALQRPKDTVTKIVGFGASRGTMRGPIRVINGTKDFPKVQTGDIIVTSMTRPEMIPVMRLAAAFVTDEGGVTCHAAIVAREMKKPCIIGTKIATQVLKDGDMVEVDAERGIVQILK